MPLYFFLAILLIDAAWLIFFLVWITMAFFAKRTAYRQSRAQRLIYFLPGLIAYLLIRFSPALADLLFNRTPLTTFTGVALTWIGIAFAIWARLHLKGNWSGFVTLKENHELIQSGPYAIVRHPIYTGILTAIIGTLLGLIPTAATIIIILLILLAFVYKMRQEEQLMIKTFGNQYLAYRKRTKALIPFIF